MIKIDVIIPICGKRGGVENVLNDWNNKIDKSRFDIRFFIFNGLDSFFDIKDNVYTIESNVAIISCETMAANYMEVVKAFGAPDICIASIWPFVTKACKMVIEELGLNTSIVSWIHNNIDEFNEGEVLGTIEDLLWADYHLCINKNLKNELLRLQADSRIFYIGNPVKKMEYENYNPQPRTIAFVGRIDGIKRVDTIIKALACTKNTWQLKVVGDGEELLYLQELVFSFSLEEQVSFLGWQSEPFLHVLDTSILVAASESEGFSVSVLEALSLGMNVISTPVPGAIDIIESGKNGYLFEIGNFKELANILNGIDSGDLPLGSPEACKKSMEDFEASNYYSRLGSIFEQIAADE